MKAFLLLIIGLCFAGQEFLTSENCHESCKVCFSNSLDFCYVCKDGLYYDVSGICVKDGVKLEEEDKCPQYSYWDSQKGKCINCPFECNSCGIDEENGSKQCYDCYEGMGIPQDDNKPYEAFGEKICHCFGFLDQGACTYCITGIEIYDQETMSCIKDE